MPQALQNVLANELGISSLRVLLALYARTLRLLILHANTMGTLERRSHAWTLAFRWAIVTG